MPDTSTSKRLTLNAAELAAIMGRDIRTITKMCRIEPALGARHIASRWSIPIAKAAAVFGVESDDLKNALEDVK